MESIHLSQLDYAVIAGFIAGCFTGFLHTKGKINPLLAGILMMIALYSINLRIMGRPNIPLLNESTVFNQIAVWWDMIGIDRALKRIRANDRTRASTKNVGHSHCYDYCHISY